MRLSIKLKKAAAFLLAIGGFLSPAVAQDFGATVQNLLRDRSDQLFGVEKPLTESALGPYNGLDNTKSVIAAKGLKVTAVSNVTNALADMIALWPNDTNPTHLIVAGENGTPGVQVVDLSGNPNSNVKTIVDGLVSADPVKRTPWGTIIVGEEAGDGGLYEIIDPLGIASTIHVTDRATGANSDPTHLVKRQKVGALAFEGIANLKNGTMYYGDENRPGNGTAGGGIFKFVPLTPFIGSTPITNLANSPLVAGSIYAMRLGTRSGNTDYGQGTEIGKGIWAPVTALPDASGNINLRAFQQANKITGYYRPEDMDLDEAAESKGIVRACWTNTGNMSNGGNSVVETAAIYGEILCLRDDADAAATTRATPQVTRFFIGDPDANFFDNVDIQPGTGNMAVLEDGEVSVKTASGATELRGNDIWMLLPDGKDRDTLTDGAIKILSLTDTDAEPTGWIFDASGENAYVNIQHRSTGLGALLKISGFNTRRDDRNDRDH